VDFLTITVQDFKDEFKRAFPYLSNIYWLSTKNYFIKNQVYLESNTFFYQALTQNINKSPEANPTDWELYEDSELNYVTDGDIEKAFTEAQAVFNPAIFPDENTFELAYLYLTAHFLSLDLRSASQGVNSNAPTTVSSRSVGSVSESYAVPKAWNEDPNLQFYTTSYYGAKYLSMVTPLLTGNIQAVLGATLP
jgi:hypothetical protein